MAPTQVAIAFTVATSAAEASAAKASAANAFMVVTSATAVFIDEATARSDDPAIAFSC